METVASALRERVTSAAAWLRAIPEAEAAIKPAPEKWSKKEILGHLIDSAANNHQRFVRLQLASVVNLPGYDGDEWVRLQRYQDRPWSEIVSLWQMYNVQLAALVRTVDARTLQNVWHTPDGKDLDLEFIIRDYVVHMRHHLDQIL